MDQRPNIILVIVDTLRYDRLGSSGYRPALTPNIDKLVANGLSFSNNHANGCVTSVAFPSIFTSTLPLDYGGYEDGIHNRPTSFPEILKNVGYENYGLITGHPCSSHFGYDRGFNYFYDLIDLYQWFRAAYVTFLSELIEDFQTNKNDTQKIKNLIARKYNLVLIDTLKYLDKQDSMPVRLGGGGKRARIRKKVEKELSILKENKNLIIEKLILLGEEYQNYLGVCRVSKLQISINKFRRALFSTCNKRLFLLSRRRAVGAKYINALFARLVAKKHETPVFFTVHFFDLHEAKLQVSKLLASANIFEFWDFAVAAYKCMKNRPGKNGGRLYDIALKKIDDQVGRLVETIQRSDLGENTIILVTGDHGTEAGYPVRNFGTDLSRLFYDEHLHVPLIIFGRGIEPSLDKRLVSHLDLAPTLVSLAGCKVPDSFSGTDIVGQRQNVKGFIWSENAGKGRCLVRSKRLFFGRRSDRWKIIGYADNFEPRISEVYDLHKDPYEQENLVDRVTDDFLNTQLNAFKKRMTEIETGSRGQENE